MTTIQTEARDWDAGLLRSKQRASGLVQPERLSTPGLRLSLGTRQRARPWRVRLGAALLALAICGLSYWSVSSWIAAPSPNPDRAVSLPDAVASHVVPPPAAAETVRADPDVDPPTPTSTPDARRLRNAGVRQRSHRTLQPVSTVSAMPTAREPAAPALEPAMMTTGETPRVERAPLAQPALQPSAAQVALHSTSPQPLAASVPLTPPRAAVSTDNLQPQIDALHVRGSLATSAVRRALERLRPLFTRCYTAASPALRRSVVQVEVSIDEVGRVRDPHTRGGDEGALAGCIAATSKKLVAEAPDTGTVSVTWQLRLAQ